MSTEKRPRKKAEISAYQLFKALVGGSRGPGGGGNWGSSIMGQLVRQRQAESLSSNDPIQKPLSPKVVKDVKKSDDSET